MSSLLRLLGKDASSDDEDESESEEEEEVEDGEEKENVANKNKKVEKSNKRVAQGSPKSVAKKQGRKAPTRKSAGR